MNRLLLILILTFSFQSWTKADDIRDFEIEGMSIGDSLLNYMSKEKINNSINANTAYIYPDKAYVKIIFQEYKNSTYDDVGFVIKYNSRDYVIHSVSGRNYCEQIQTCLDTQSEVISTLKKMFKNVATLVQGTDPHYIDPTGESTVHMADFNFIENNAKISASVYDWSVRLNKKNGWFDCLQIDIASDEFTSYLQKFN